MITKEKELANGGTLASSQQIEGDETSTKNYPQPVAQDCKTVKGEFEDAPISLKDLMDQKLEPCEVKDDDDEVDDQGESEYKYRKWVSAVSRRMETER